MPAWLRGLGLFAQFAPGRAHCRQGRATGGAPGGSRCRDRRCGSRDSAPPCRERRQACSALARPIIFDSLISGWSISNCTSAVVAGVEPCIGPRRSMQTTSWPLAVSASAIIAPLMPMPTTSTSVLMSRVSAPSAPWARDRRTRRAAGSEVELAGHEILRRVGAQRPDVRPVPVGPFLSPARSSRRTIASITAMPSALSLRQGMWAKFSPPACVEGLAPPRGRSRPASRCSRPKSRD